MIEPPMIPVNEPLLDGNELKYVTECIKTGWISSEGPFVTQFEETFATTVGRRYGIAVTNGSAALDLALHVLDLEKGDEVIMPTFTIISCAAAIVRTGAKPVLVDSDLYTWNMDVNQIEAKITKRTKAIMVVHIYGLPVDMNPVLNLARKYGLKIIEDAAEAHGLFYQDRPCGSFGDISVFSFYPNKHITTGEGGMVVTNNAHMAEACRKFRNLCFIPPRRFVHEELGWNYRFTNIQAAIGLAQLERLKTHMEIKKEMGITYSRLLGDLTTIQLPLSHTDYANNAYWVYGVVLKGDESMDSDTAIKRLAEVGVGTRPFFWPMHQQPVFKKKGWFKDEIYPVAERLGRNGFYLPSGLTLTHNQQKYVSDQVHQLFVNKG